jgi:hypothetical protein
MSDSLTFRLYIRTDTPAFVCHSPHHPDDPQGCGRRRFETARILRAVAARLEQGEEFLTYQTLVDENENDVGRAAFKEDTAEEREASARANRLRPARRRGPRSPRRMTP